MLRHAASSLVGEHVAPPANAAAAVQVARWLGERLAQPYTHKYVKLPERDCPLPDRYQSECLTHK